MLAQKMSDNPLKKQLEGHKIILASASPRRKQFLKDLGIDFEVRIPDLEETYPEELEAADISDYLAVLKASQLRESLQPHEILITSDTVVWHNGQSLAKASTAAEAGQMLEKLSGSWHEVITSVCFTTTALQKVEHAITKVKFRQLRLEEIEFYIASSSPFDKAGAYGIQDWLGAVAIEEIRGSYNNVVGLPSHLVYKTLMDMVA